jgi:hypothetical protein
MVRKHQTRNLKIPGAMLTHRPEMTAVELSVTAALLTTADNATFY